MLSNALKLTFPHPKIIGILHPRYHQTITGHILKNKQRNKHVCIHEIMQSIIMKMKTKMKIDSCKYGINRPRCRHEHKYSKYMKSLSMMMLMCIKQHLSNIWTSVFENVKQHWGWVEKKALLIEKACSQVTMPSIVRHAYIYDKHYTPCLKINNIRLGKIMQAYGRNKFIIKKLIEWK